MARTKRRTGTRGRTKTVVLRLGDCVVRKSGQRVCYGRARSYVRSRSARGRCIRYRRTRAGKRCAKYAKVRR